eukprot:scaffold11068_cov129-Skeletonema_menzelii.AAC.5
MRVINKVVLIGGVAYAYAHPDLSNNATGVDTDAAATPCPYSDVWFDFESTEENDNGGLDDTEGAQQGAIEQRSSSVLKGSASNNTVSTMELRRNNTPVKKKRTFRRNGNKKKQSSAGSSPNIYLPNADPSTGTQASRNQDQIVDKEVRNGKCFTTAMYNAIDADVMRIKNNISDIKQRGSFLGGLLRLVAHDAMDFDPNRTPRMGADGCYDPNHPNNAGLENVWSSGSALMQVYDQKYSQLSIADFWVACANAAIRQSSIGQQLDMKDSFRWGRKDAVSCNGQGNRLPSTRGCSQTEDVFLNRMGMTWEDAVALMGGHTLGHGNRDNSGHHGTWAPNNSEATVFDKKYYEQLFMNNWRVSGFGNTQDWRTGNPGNDRMMLNTDICLAYNIDSGFACCTTGNFQCRQCPRYTSNSPRKAAERAVLKMLGGVPGNTNNDPFYESFERAWNKMTSVGQSDLMPLSTECE